MQEDRNAGMLSRYVGAGMQVADDRSKCVGFGTDQGLGVAFPFR